MSRHEDLLSSILFMKDLRNLDLSSREVGLRWNVGKTFINKHRATTNSELIVQPAATTTQSSDGSRTTEFIRSRPVTLRDARDWVASTGDNPDDYDIGIRSIAYGMDQSSNRMSATPKKRRPGTTTLTADDFENASKFIEGFTYIPAKKDYLVDVAVIQPTDEQIGKTDFNGGTDETVQRVIESYTAAADYINEYRPRHVILAHTGDPIENVCNTSSQRDTNDMDLPHQILTAYKLDLAGVRMLSPLVERLTSAHVPSNHGRFRLGAKQDAGDSHADFGITNAKNLAHNLETFGGFDNVEVLWPEALMESMTVYTDAVNIGLVHGHQAGGPDKMGEWWKGQDHGRMPTWDADALFVGHWHSYRAYQSGDARHVFVGPANEPGSSWYSNLKGERSTSGMLAVSFIGKKWKYQEIL
jgi:predicted phosphodiesterase